MARSPIHYQDLSYDSGTKHAVCYGSRQTLTLLPDRVLCLMGIAHARFLPDATRCLMVMSRSAVCRTTMPGNGPGPYSTLRHVVPPDQRCYPSLTSPPPPYTHTPCMPSQQRAPASTGLSTTGLSATGLSTFCLCNSCLGQSQSQLPFLSVVVLPPPPSPPSSPPPPLARILGECSTIHFTLALFFFFKWRLACAH